MEAAAVADPRLTLDLRFVDDETLVREVSEASLVVLPYVEMKNSGALLVADDVGNVVWRVTAAGAWNGD